MASNKLRINHRSIPVKDSLEPALKIFTEENPSGNRLDMIYEIFKNNALILNKLSHNISTHSDTLAKIINNSYAKEEDKIAAKKMFLLRMRVKQHINDTSEEEISNFLRTPNGFSKYLRNEANFESESDISLL